MTTPTNRPPDDGLEDRLAASFDRAVKRAEVDLADGRLAANAIDRGHRRVRSGALWRAGLVLAAVAVLSAGTLWIVGGRPSPPPSPAPSLANVPGTPYATESLLPTDANGSQIPQPASSDQAIPIDQASFPPTVDGQPVYPVGGPAELKIAATTDATPFYISGWYQPLQGKYCFAESLASMAPGVTYFDKCMAGLLFARPSGGESVSYLLPVTAQGPLAFTGTLSARAYVNQALLKVHLHDPACRIPECAAEPVVDATVMTTSPIMNPEIVAQTPPAKMLSMNDAVAAALPKAQDMVGIGAQPPVFVSASLGVAALLGDDNAHTDATTTWEWKVEFVTRDGIEVVTIWVDAVTGESNHGGSTTGGGLANP